MLWKALTYMTEVFSNEEIRLGKEYYQNGQVLNVRLSDGLIKARVKGSSNQIYNVHFDLKTWPSVSTQCSCNTQKDCKHAIACLFALEARETGKLTEVEPDVLREPVFQEEFYLADEMEWYSNLKSAGNDFFSYELGILINNQPVSIVPLVIELINRWNQETLESLSENVILKLPITNQKILKIKLGRIKPLLRLLLEYSKRKAASEDALKIKKYQLLLMIEAEKAIAASSSRWQGTDELRNKLQALCGLTTLPSIPVPKGLKTQLRDYQHQGLDWLQFLRMNYLGGVLADDMGLGKTVQTLTHLLSEKENGRMERASLIIAPTSLVINWFEEAKRFTPELNICIFHGAERHKDQFEGYDVVISSYGLLQRDKKRFLDYPFYFLILDEAQSIKNTRTKTTQIVQQIQAKHRLCLTGTPLENHLGELWSLFNFLMPGFLGNSRQFRQYFRSPIEKHKDPEKGLLLAQRIKPFMLRRNKNEVAKELPSKTEMTRMVELTGKQRDLYEGIRLSMEKKVREAIGKLGLGKSQVVILDALLKLRQVCCDPKLVKLPNAVIAHESSAKMDALMELLDNIILEGRYVLIFSQFTSMLKLIEEKLNQRNYPYLKLTGQTKNRQELVHQFQNGDAPIFLISLKAGGIGLNLTRADTVIHYDPWWNPAIENQATDRSHRIGQTKPVFVYKLITAGTVEEAILNLQNKKRKMIDEIVVGGTDPFQLTEEEIKQFFMPLEN